MLMPVYINHDYSKEPIGKLYEGPHGYLIVELNHPISKNELFKSFNGASIDLIDYDIMALDHEETITKFRIIAFSIMKGTP